MKPEIKARWVENLRSGKYEQGRGVLRKDSEYCCLGVLCEMAAEEGIVETIIPEIDEHFAEVYEPEEFPTHAYRDIGADDSEVFYLPTAVQEWSDLPFNPSIEWDREGMEYQNRYLSTLNDSGKTFKEIADLIEGYL